MPLIPVLHGPVLAEHPPLCRLVCAVFGTVEPQKRSAAHFHAAIRVALPR